MHDHKSSNYIPKRILKDTFGQAYKINKKIAKPITRPPPHNSQTKQTSESTSTISQKISPSFDDTQPNDIHTTQPSQEPLSTNTSLENSKDTSSIPSSENITNTQTTSTNIPTLPSWLHHNAKITLKLKEDDPFFKGILIKNTEDLFLFHVGPSRKHGVKHPLPHQKLLELYNKGFVLRGHGHLIRSINSLPSTTQIPPSNIDPPRPPIPTEHKSISTFPSQVSFTTDQLKRAFGFRNIESILPHIKATSHSNFSITSIDKEKNLDLGEIATINKSKRNTNPLPLPLHFGDVVHMDIIYGSVTAIEGYRYGLFIVDRPTRSRFIYPMKILKTDILPTLQKFCNDIGMRPKRILTDFDHKLMGQKVLEMFTPPDCECIIDTAPPPPIIEAAPPYKQNQNGLAESNWKAILQIARAWLTSNLLPPTFWW